MKLFVQDNYTNKPINYIEDDILKRIDDYNDSISKWGFETTIATFESVLSSKGLYTSSTIAMLSKLFDNPGLAALSGGSAACIALGEIGLKVFKAQNDKINLRKDSPIAYLLTAQKELNK
ncbi:MAG: hypothetical protein JWO58_326 [Chitinophagaceae bacterium]|nr:hypothetical protein [Chitinophagaceae bacterium]